MFVQNVVIEPLVEEGKVIEKIRAIREEGYQSITVTPLDLTAEPATYGLTAVKIIEE